MIYCSGGLLRYRTQLMKNGDIAYRMLVSEEKRNQILQRMFGNPGWFARLRKTSFLHWLSNEEDIDETLLLYLVSMADIEITQLSVIDLLRPFLGKSEEWDKRLTGIVSRIQNWRTVQAVEFFEQVISRSSQLNQLDIYHIGLVSKAFPNGRCTFVTIPS